MPVSRAFSTARLQGLGETARPARGGRAFTLVEVLLAISITAILMLGLATVANSFSYSLQMNQSTASGTQAARQTVEYVTSQVRKADRVEIAGTPTSSGDPTFPYKIDEIVIVLGEGAVRSDSNPDDSIEIHIKAATIDGQPRLRLWKNTDSNVWNGEEYVGTETSGYFDVPNVKSAEIRYAGDAFQASSVQIILTVWGDDPGNNKTSTTLTGVATVRRF